MNEFDFNVFSAQVDNAIVTGGTDIPNLASVLIAAAIDVTDTDDRAMITKFREGADQLRRRIEKRSASETTQILSTALAGITSSLDNALAYLNLCHKSEGQTAGHQALLRRALAALGSPARAEDLARTLDVDPLSVSRGLQQLIDLGEVEFAPTPVSTDKSNRWYVRRRQTPDGRVPNLTGITDTPVGGTTASVSAFDLGTVVALSADTARRGPIVGVLDPVGDRRRYRVYHSATEVRSYFEDQLIPVESEWTESWAERIKDEDWVEPAAFRARLTASRLRSPQTDHIYALHAARIQFIPFQFKPLLRVLRAERPRILIADDVGVGKTIEAGLILKELQTRTVLDRVLVLCPKALTFKWKAELRRFDEDLRILDSAALRYCLDETASEGVWPTEYAKSIVHYELFRMERYLRGEERPGRQHPGLLDLDPPAEFDLVIADEAHHLRTAGTGVHRLMEHLCQTAEAVLMLSATPVQVHSDNLFTLLNLLRPDLFPDVSVFREAVEPNQYITAAVSTLRAGEAATDRWQQEASIALTEASKTSWGATVLRADPTYRSVFNRLAGPALSADDRVWAIRELEEVHTLAHVMNRTRRRDIGRFTIRDPHTVSVPFTPDQSKLYNAVISFRCHLLSERYDPRVTKLILDTLERQAASSINAIVGVIDQLLASGRLNISDLTDDPESYDEPVIPTPTGLEEEGRVLLDAARNLSDDDPKFAQLLHLVRDTLDDEGPGKVLVFSYFLHTIDYLRNRLEREGVRVGVVTGKVKDEEREAIRDRFRKHRDSSTAIDVLLSSEVGCEGLDYEFCDRLVNYDIPWNPMRIEQRIGRIDRFGQAADKVMIFNFITPGTVEERIFFRCFERIGVFRDTVGDLEEVLGELVEDLTRIAIDSSLTPAQAEARSQQLADNAMRLADEQRRLDDRSSELMGLDTAFTNEVDDVVSEGRFVSGDELENLVRTFLAAPPISEQLRGIGPILQLRISESSRRELLARARTLPVTRHATAFLSALEGDSLPLTFDQKTAAQHRDLLFITPIHPLARLATTYWSSVEGDLVAGIRVRDTRVEAGWYVFVCEQWETIAARPDVRLVCLAVDLQSGQLHDGLSRRLLGMLTTAEGLSSPVPPHDRIQDRLAQLDELSDARRRATLSSLVETNEFVLARQLASLDSSHALRTNRVSGELAGATNERIRRMKQSQLARITADHERRRSRLEQRRRIDITTSRIAAGLIEVVK